LQDRDKEVLREGIIIIGCKKKGFPNKKLVCEPCSHKKWKNWYTSKRSQGFGVKTYGLGEKRNEIDASLGTHGIGPSFLHI
jgi:hypothetical protein